LEDRDILLAEVFTLGKLSYLVHLTVDERFDMVVDVWSHSFALFFLDEPVKLVETLDLLISKAEISRE
jgi:hypothetical protein